MESFVTVPWNTKRTPFYMRHMKVLLEAITWEKKMCTIFYRKVYGGPLSSHILKTTKNIATYVNASIILVAKMSSHYSQ
jgi:hypothetical protein